MTDIETVSVAFIKYLKQIRDFPPFLHLPICEILLLLSTPHHYHCVAAAAGPAARYPPLASPELPDQTPPQLPAIPLSSISLSSLRYWVELGQLERVNPKSNPTHLA
uniref:Uncharacterized protein n=1 Tax=Solanum tuberosum TaxID=4113 RepID=M1DLC7_SOLTU